MLPFRVTHLRGKQGVSLRQMFGRCASCKTERRVATAAEEENAVHTADSKSGASCRLCRPDSSPSGLWLALVLVLRDVCLTQNGYTIRLPKCSCTHGTYYHRHASIMERSCSPVPREPCSIVSRLAGKVGCSLVSFPHAVPLCIRSRS
ncbi:hypothetical protein FVE85_5774 [Porphyridium purpureum]|uniref:Uncharacterized protein n=1 Tax=Porphyridium purpureum TaxID=35688 RepID=A0A5J4Z2L3_PORPP|nr:hypothetical protein FVE85_5774 [Porphyridium purpureum]|eukprot:POR4941..scf295_1